ncbi:MAG TPA: histidine kinase [Solirubrobacteraceae bacterium]|nr:histidine kinase [Solirubrobacteraceae bacterium]
MSSAVRSFLAEPRAPDPPTRVWRDWALLAVIATGAALETIFREDLIWRPVGLVVCVALSVTLLWRRTQPLLATAVAFGGTTVLDTAARLFADEPTAFLLSSGFLLLFPYSLLRWGSGRDAAAGMCLVVGLQILTEGAAGNVGDLIAGVAFFLLSGAIGASVRYRTTSRTRERDQVKLREREQLARELHDTVAHHVSAIAIRAQAGRTLAATQPAAAVDALEVIEEAASRALTDLRAIVGALRDGDEAELAPQRGVADVARLAADGLQVDVVLAGDLDGLQPMVGAAVYRIAQESITNAVRHARHATRIDVRVTGERDCVRLAVLDDGEPGAAQPPGYGLAGMTERAALLGGTLEAGPGPGRGWLVTATLPRTAA